MILNSPYISGSLTVTGNEVVTGSLTVLGGITGAITGSATSASYAETASYAATASYLNSGVWPYIYVGSASYAVNASYLNNSGSGEFVPTGSFNTFSSSILSYTASNNTNIGNIHSTTASLNTFSGSTNSRLSSIESTTASLNAASGSAITRLSALEVTSGSNITRISALEAASGSAITRLSALEVTSGSNISRLSSLESKTGSYATTGSNTFVAAQYISQSSNPTGFTTTASLYTDGGLRVSRDAYISGTLYLNNVTVYGTQSVCFITSSQLNISSNIISVNTATPSVRFGGLAVYDSGSTGLTGSILWDSQDNQWIYSNPSGSAYDSAMFLVGPRNTGALGSEVGIECNFLSKGNGMHHMTSSAIFDDGTRTCFYGSSIITSTGVGCFSGAVCASAFVGGTVSGTTSTFVSGVISGTPANTSSLLLENFNGDQTATTLRLKSGRADVFYHMQAFSSNTSEVFRIESSGRVVSAAGACFASTVCAPAFVGGTVSGTTGTFSSNVTGTSFITDGSTLFGITLKGRAADNFGAIGFYSSNGATRYGYIQSHSCNNGQLNINADGGAQIIGDCRGLLLQPSSGNVGVGTTTPGYKLDVNGTGRYVGSLTINEDGGGTKVLTVRSDWAGVDPAINVTTNNCLLLMTNNTVRVCLSNTGIATFACQICSTTISATTEFRLGASFTRIATLDAGGSFGGGYNLNWNNGSPIHDSTGTISGYGYSNDGSIRLYTNSSQAANTAACERIRIISTGEVGIGVTPTAGNRFWVRGSSTSSGDTAIFAQNSGGTSLFVVKNNGEVQIPNGCVGINTTSPDTLLTIDTQIANFSTGTLARLYASKGTTEGAYLQIQATRHSTQSVRRVELYAYEGASCNANLVLQPNGGCAGVGTYVPGTTLEVRGTGNQALNSKGNLFVADGGTATQAAGEGGQLSFGAWLNGDLSAPYPLAAIKGISECSQTNFNNGALIFGTMDSNTTVQERMRINSIGNVGISTSAPLGTTAERTIHLSDGGCGYATVYVTNSTNAVRSIFGMQSVNGLGIVGTQTNNPFAIYTNDTERIRFTNTGIACFANVVCAPYVAITATTGVTPLVVDQNQSCGGYLRVGGDHRIANGATTMFEYVGTVPAGGNACVLVIPTQSQGNLHTRATFEIHGVSAEYNLNGVIKPFGGVVAIEYLNNVNVIQGFNLYGTLCGVSASANCIRLSFNTQYNTGASCGVTLRIKMLTTLPWTNYFNVMSMQ